MSNSYSFATAGPVRPGLIEVKVLSNSSNSASPPLNADAIVSAVIGVSNTGVGPYIVDCVNSGPAGPNCNGYYDTLFASRPPSLIRLGAPLILTDFTSVSTSSYAADGFASGTLDITYQFRLFEADGITPVAVLTPEPGSLALFLSVASLLLLSASEGLSARRAYLREGMSMP